MSWASESGPVFFCVVMVSFRGFGTSRIVPIRLLWRGIRAGLMPGKALLTVWGLHPGRAARIACTDPGTGRGRSAECPGVTKQRLERTCQGGMALHMRQAYVAGGASYSKIKNMRIRLSDPVKFSLAHPRFPLPAAGH
ncbi:hypothetical protein GCM10027038_03000 [Arthrobacter bambusae]